MELFTELKEEATEEFINTILTEEFLEEEPTLTMLNELIRELENSPVVKSKQHRLKMLGNDINNRDRTLHGWMMHKAKMMHCLS